MYSNSPPPDSSHATVVRTLVGFELEEVENVGKYLVCVQHISIRNSHLMINYPYAFLGTEEAPRTLGGIFEQGIYKWDARISCTVWRYKKPLKQEMTTYTTIISIGSCL